MGVSHHNSCTFCRIEGVWLTWLGDVFVVEDNRALLYNGLQTGHQFNVVACNYISTFAPQVAFQLFTLWCALFSEFIEIWL